tara:strand:+ start:584 stop:739 length:156 start_codon:yes stop_codon:yes gene_type:complete
MDKPLTLEKEGARVETGTRSYRKWKKRQEAIKEASGNGRCWWIEQYLKAKI